MARNFDDWLSAYVQYTAPLEAPEVFHYWTGISVIAAALRRKVWFSQKYFIWAPNFYIVFVGPPGTVNKSTTVSIGMRLLERVPGVNFGPDAITWQRLVQKMAEIKEGVQFGDDITDCTIMPMSCLTIASSEFGTLINPQDREMIDVLTDLWDGRTSVWKKETKTSESDEIHNPWINFITCTTPAWLAGNIPRHMVDAGFFARTLFVYRERKRRVVAYPAEEVPDGFDEFGDKLVHDLEEISLLKGEYTLTPEARLWGTQWYHRHTKQVEEHDPKLARLGTYASRKQTHLHKIAMVLSASSRGDLRITDDDLRLALQVLEDAERDMGRVYSLASDERSISNANLVVDLVRKHGRMPRDMAYRALYSRMSYEDYGRAITDAVMAQRIRVETNSDRVFLKILEDDEEGKQK